MSDTNKTDKQESSGFLMNPMNLYGVGGVPFPVFTPQFGPMVPLRMMAPMWPMNTPFMQPYTESFSGALSKPPSDTPYNTPSIDQPGCKTMPFMWPMNVTVMQEYMKSMNASMSKLSSDASSADSLTNKSSTGTMMAPMWSMNAAFMQQYMESFGRPMASPVIGSGASVEQPTSEVSGKKGCMVGVAATASSVIQLQGHSDKLPIKNKENMGSDNAVEVNDVTENKPKALSTNHSDKIAEMTFPTGSLFMPFSNIAGFIPYTTYIPYFRPVDVNQGSPSEKKQQVEPTKSQAQEKTESSSPPQAMEEDKSCSVPTEGKQEPVVASLESEPSDNHDISQQGETSLPNDSECPEVADTGNSAEMDVAQILVNFMPVPVIGNGIQEDVDEQEGSLIVVEEGTVPLAAQEIDLNATMDNHDLPLSSDALPYSVAHNCVTEEQEESLDSNKAEISQVRSSDFQKSAEVTPKVDSMEVSVIKSSKDAVMEAKESSMKPDTRVLEGIMEEHVTKPSSGGQVMQHVCRGQVPQPVIEGQATQHVFKGQVIQHVFREQVTQPVSESQGTHVFEEQVTQGISEGQATPQVSEGQVMPCVCEVAPVLEVKQEYDSTDQYEVNGGPVDIADTNGEIPRMAKVTYKCEVCSQLFRSSLGLQKHLEFHTDDGQHYTCTICFERFQDSSTLQDHIAYHMRKRPYKCQFCPKAFRDPGSLQKHVRVHTGEKPYKCTNCFRSFAEYSSLRKHLRVHTGEQPYKCQYCSKAFSISGNLQRHVLIHTGERPYKCSFCPKAFNNPSHLRRHVKNLHFKGEGGSGADVMIAMAAAVAAAEGKMALGNGEMAEGATPTANNGVSSSETFTTIAPYKNDRDQSAITEKSMIIKMDLPAAISQPVDIK